MLIEERISFGELLSVDPSEFVSGRHDQATTVYRVSIPRLKLDVLNLLPPRRKAFWSFGIFGAQQRQMSTFLDAIRRDSIEYIIAEHERLGFNKKSINTYEFLAPITKAEGLAFYPYSVDGPSLPYWWFAQRHIVCVCPAADSSRYVEYFCQQEIQIGESCYIDAPDDLMLVDESQYENSQEYISLSRYVGALSKSERVLTEANLLDEMFISNSDETVLRVIGRSGGPNVALLEKLADYDDAERVRTILCARVKLATCFATLLDIEQMRTTLGEFWHPVDRKRMLEEIDTCLNKYPVVKSIIE